VLLALALTGCGTSAEKSAKLELAAKQQQAAAARRRALALRGMSITRLSTKVEVAASAILHSSEGDAVVLTLDNHSSTSLRDVPIQITVRDARGAPLYRNDVPGTATALISAPLLRAHSATVWIDDQIQASGIPASVDARIGEGEPTSVPTPTLSVEQAHLTEGSTVEGEVVNHSTIAQQALVVDAIARRGGKIVAAGRAVVSQAAGGEAATHFQLYLIGNPAGARLELSAPPTMLG
jgi:hypothetical protein